MGSKKYKNTTCAYCLTRQSTTGDHVFAREFFLPSKRDRHPIVPCCEQCNFEKSKLEHYLASIFPFGGRHPDAYENLTCMLPPRLKGNRKLHCTLEKFRRRVWTLEDGLYKRTMAIPINPEYVYSLFKYIARGLAYYHWMVTFDEDCIIDVFTPTDIGQEQFDKLLFRLNARNRVYADLGKGTVIYEGAQGIDSSQISIWRILMYGGICFSGSLHSDATTGGQIIVMTGPKSME